MSLQNSHTPGPWFATWNHQNVKSAESICHIYPESQRGDRFLMEVGVVYCASPGTEAEANARLMATAPELLEALNAAYVALARHADDPKVGKALVLVGNAINKAEGC
ncbi:hypothetical protein CMPELA_25775 [Cupriavidus necator]|uniref:Uncharacterized protein n=1 Tax=Cupriavidus necator (strain ATCC 17699 / DSM 428 / KCTC 22496 / NCIMB 10442 / H16 / Stanier 337) TaxID=381666 RepID=Q0K1K7_CUPNH|nr:hypothetical protein [Cupriavidus necator]QCC03982.1 hypothetical protein E6A55_25900 [Cupriavidus necator H16]QQB81042.1 hypothetical protein I6H87_25480 [Cupriavidus necator]WKA42878.1 hypothetical protein QWP09_25950 [Cupriavidus necator]CAJ96117.1 Hypothetical protein H16_B1327 [Cupriavidus necator H16]